MVTSAIAGYAGAVYYRPRVKKTTISFTEDGPDTILDSGFDFVKAGFLPNKNVVVSGSTSNDGSYLVDTVGRGTLTLDGGESLTAEVAGDLVTIIQTEEVQLLGFHNWELPNTIDTQEVTAFDSNGNKEYIAALKDWDVSASRYFQTGAIINGQITISFADTDPDTILDSGNGFVAAGFRAGGGIAVAGSVSNNGNYTVDTVAAGVLTLIAGDALAVEGTGATVTIVQPVVLYAGNTYRTRLYVDKSGGKYFYGDCILTNRTINMPVDSMVGVDLSFKGTGALTAVGL